MPVAVQCSICPRVYTVKSSKVVEKNVSKHGRVVCNTCAIAAKARARNLAVLAPFLVGSLPVTTKEFFTARCPNCPKVYQITVANFLRRKNDKYFGWCRECVQQTPEVSEAISIVQVGREHRPKTLKERLHLSDVMKEKWQNEEQRLKYLTACADNRYPDKNNHTTEKRVKAWLTDLGVEANKGIIGGVEVDILIPHHKLGIEYCGLYWHNEMSPVPRGKSYHFAKYQALQKEGWKLITIFEDEWLTRKEVVKSILSAKLGLSPNTIGARKTEVVVMSKEKAHDFLRLHHLQQSPGISHIRLAIGLQYQGDIVQVATFGRHHRGSTPAMTLNRMCTKVSWSVSGGASRLIKAAQTQLPGEGIVSWSDNRWSTGGLYRSLGFILTNESGPDYSYCRNAKRYSKQSQKKTKEEQLLDATEWELRAAQKMFRIWDCGKKTWYLPPA